ncbi:AAA family ATPase [Dactylosporangium sucinum]|uniref:Transcriptional regulator n=1 Tax=Dactylosporangium sucinum TaxID=1424081 RepID=A0A917X878_9ACTN|nr:LuxR family transcriptional regulator [Dactylosporangium sucinum]GGM88267.1 transcriptional regulator [Dactylosporangium sucinum]
MAITSVIGAPQLFGRAAELATVRRLVAGAHAGHGAALVVRGAIGAGKSALLSVVEQEVTGRGFAVSAIEGVDSVGRLPYDGLRRLLAPFLRHAAELRPHHQQALRAAFDRHEAEPAVHAVALASLELLAEAGPPVALLADDLHWLDRPTCVVLSFVARRIGDLRILVVAATGPGGGGSRLPGLPELHLGGLADADAERLLDATAPRLPPAVRGAVLAQAGGNPLAIVELPRALRPPPAPLQSVPLAAALAAAPAGGARRATARLTEAPRPGAAPAKDAAVSLEAAFAARAAALGPAARALLLVAAAEPGCDAGRLRLAASALAGESVGPGVVDEVAGAGLLLVAGTGSGLRFRHPLVRSAVYGRAGVAERLAAHEALAEVLGDDPHRQLWHRAAAATGADEALSLRLEECGAGRADALALAAVRRAAELTRDAGRRGGLLVRAAELAVRLGAHAEAAALVAEAEQAQHPDHPEAAQRRGRLLSLAEAVAFRPDGGASRIRELVAAARASGSGQIGAELLFRAGARCFFHGGQDATGAEERAAVAEALDALPIGPDDQRRLAILAYNAPDTHGADVLRRLARLAPTGVEELRNLASAAFVLGDLPRAARWHAGAADASREQGLLGSLARALGVGGWGRIWLGELDRAVAESVEACELAAETGEHTAEVFARANLAMVAALRGDADAADGHLDGIEHMPLPGGLQQVKARLALLDGRPGHALRLLTDGFTVGGHPSVRWWLAPDLADAGVAAGAVAEAREVLGGLAEAARRIPAPMMLVCADYAAAVLQEDPHRGIAEALRGELGRWPLFRARLLLHHGERRPDPEALRAALAVFDDLGLAPWAARARAALGRPAAPEPVRPAARLPARELQIAHLAAEGLTNRQIAERLYVSHRTVAARLARVYARLGVTSRASLATALNRRY